MLQPAEPLVGADVSDDVWEHACSRENLAAALAKLIRTSGPGCGVDGVSIREFRPVSDPDGEKGFQLVDQFQHEFVAGTYRPLSVRRVEELRRGSRERP